MEHHAKLAGDNAESQTRNRYRIDDEADLPHDVGVNVERGKRGYLIDLQKGGRVVESGEIGKLNKRINSLAKTARNKAESNVREKVNSVIHDIRDGFYKSVPDGGISDLDRALSGAMKEASDNDL